MEKKFIFVIGGARSGKTSFALGLAASMPGPRRYLATAEALDGEMLERIGRHKKERQGDWVTVEEPLQIVSKVNGEENGVVLIDCLTLWVSNLLGSSWSDGRILSEAGSLACACRGSGAKVIAVSNEVGLGLVPENRLARRFRDVSGAVNQIMAGAADEVYFISAGLPLKMK